MRIFQIPTAVAERNLFEPQTLPIRQQPHLTRFLKQRSEDVITE